MKYVNFVMNFVDGLCDELDYLSIMGFVRVGKVLILAVYGNLIFGMKSKFGWGDYVVEVLLWILGADPCLAIYIY